MALTSDHMAWQQRVFKETNASSKFLDLDNKSLRSIGKYSINDQLNKSNVTCKFLERLIKPI